MTNWLVAHDFSPCSDAALAHASKLAAAAGATLNVLHAHADLRVPTEHADGSETFEAEKRIADQLASAAASLRDRYPDLKVETSATTGPPAETILEEADRLNAEMIIVGTHGRTGLSALVLGSVAERVAKASKRPVLVVKAEE